MFKEILVAYDGSDCSKKAIATAIDFIERDPEVQLHVVHVKDSLPINVYGLYGPNLSQNLISEFDAAADALLLEAQDMLTAHEEVCSYSRLEGNAADEIVKYVNVYEIDLVIIGSRGLGAVRGMLMGSVSSRVVQEVDCHVLIIK